MSTANLTCPECGNEIDIDVKRVGREFAVVSGCRCGQSEKIESLLVSDHEDANLDLLKLRNGPWNRRKGERRQHA